jgi:Domain of unknown function (DUF4258)
MAGNVVHLSSARAAIREAAEQATAFESRVHELAKVSANIHFSHPHFQARLTERKVTMRQVLEVLRKGCVIDGPTVDKWGDMRVKLQRKVAGRRVQIVVAVKEKYLDVVTAI